MRNLYISTLVGAITLTAVSLPAYSTDVKCSDEHPTLNCNSVCNEFHRTTFPCTGTDDDDRFDVDGDSNYTMISGTISIGTANETDFCCNVQSTTKTPIITTYVNSTSTAEDIVDAQSWPFTFQRDIIVYASDGDDDIRGGAGADKLYLGCGDNTGRGYDGNDDIIVYCTGTTDQNTIRGGNGNDYIEDGDGPAILLDGEAGDDEIWGGDGDDYIEGGSGNDDLYGEKDEDEIYGEGGMWDCICGGYGTDIIDGGDNDLTDFCYDGLDTLSFCSNSPPNTEGYCNCP